LGGAGSVRDFLQSKGKNVAVDGNGVPITNYMTSLGGKDVSSITGNKTVVTQNVGAYQFTGDERTYIPTSKGKKDVKFDSITANNQLSAKVASGGKPEAQSKLAQASVETPAVKSATQMTTAATQTQSSAEPKIRSAKQQDFSTAPVRAPEPKSVVVANASQIGGKEKDKPSMQPVKPSASSAPSIDSIPLLVDDMGIVLINTGIV
jgi:hypothetical protein